MAWDKHFSAWSFCLLCFFLHVSLPRPALSAPEGDFHHPGPREELSRTKRGVCVDGTYEYEGRNCCLCSAGQFLKKHCVASPDDRVCEYCEKNTYNSHPNSQETCVRCTSCSQRNANLEVAEQCTIARDTKCQCKKDYYCKTGSCITCIPCTVCESTVVKEACTATSDTVCSDTEANNTGPIIAGVVAGLLIISILAGVAYFFWRKRQAANTQQGQVQKNGPSSSGPDVEMQDLLSHNVDLQRHLPLIAEELGWKDMEHLAMRGNITDAVIESCKLDHPGDSQEQTLQLLKRWVEKQGRGASTELIRMLQESGKKAKVEKIQEILKEDQPAG